VGLRMRFSSGNIGPDLLTISADVQRTIPATERLTLSYSPGRFTAKTVEEDGLPCGGHRHALSIISTQHSYT
jgi:hypothetical protein